MIRVPQSRFGLVMSVCGTSGELLWAALLRSMGDATAILDEDQTSPENSGGITGNCLYVHEPRGRPRATPNKNGIQAALCLFWE